MEAIIWHVKNNLSKFDQYIYQVTGGTIEMGVIETIKRWEREKGFKQGFKQGLKLGTEKFKREKTIAIALEFKKMGIAIADISKGTGLSVEEIKKLK